MQDNTQECQCQETDRDVKAEPRRYKKFREDMKDAGLEVREYQGRYFYSGPSVVVSNIQVAIRATEVEVQWDNMGRDYVVYPK